MLLLISFMYIYGWLYIYDLPGSPKQMYSVPSALGEALLVVQDKLLRLVIPRSIEDITRIYFLLEYNNFLTFH